jgi:hypothetical protein
MVPRKFMLALFGVTLLLFAASSPAQASTTPRSLHAAHLTSLVTHTGATIVPMSWCTSYHHKSYVSAWGYVNFGYVEIDVGVCYDDYWNPTIVWGPFCSSGWYVPFMRTSATDYCGTYSNIVYGGWTGQLWLPAFGWCCDRFFWYQYGV